MTNKTCDEYATAALLKAAVEALETSVTFDIIPYREEGTTKFMLVSPSGQPFT